MLLLTLMIINHSPVQAGDGGYLLEACQSGVKLWNGLPGNNEDRDRTSYCSGLVNGVMATMIINGNSLPPSEARIVGICNTNPSDKGKFLKTDQSIRVVLKYLEEHPEKLHEADAILAINALRKAFPCP
ncbi:MAG: Rap1a/Tai family immunity protein [Methylobacter sp.]